jgi:hypothetical protein
MMDSPYLRRATDLDGMAVNVTTTLIQSLTLIHGGALVAAPAFAEQFKPILQSPYLVLMFGFFATGLVLAIFAGIFAFYALSRRSDENLELWNSGGSINLTVENHFMKFQRHRHIAIAFIILSTVCLLSAACTSYSILSASGAMHQATRSTGLDATSTNWAARFVSREGIRDLALTGAERSRQYRLSLVTSRNTATGSSAQ